MKSRLSIIPKVLFSLLPLVIGAIGLVFLQKTAFAATSKTFTAKVIVERGGEKAEARTAVTVYSSSDTTPLTFVAYGDSRYQEVHSTLINLALSHNPEFVLHMGDMIMYYDGVDGDNWTTQWENVITPWRDRGIPIYPTMGNHEITDVEGKYNCSNTAAIQEYRRHFPTINFNAYGDYSFDAKNAHFISIDNFCFMGTPAKFDWINQDLAANRGKILFAFMHQPYYTTGQGCTENGVAGGVSEQLLRIFRENKVSVVFSGHDHSYQRLSPPNETATFFVTAGGGDPLWDRTCSTTWESVHIKKFHFLLVKVYDNRVEIQAIDNQGVTIDQYTKYPPTASQGSPLASGLVAAAQTTDQPRGGYPKIMMPSGGMSLPSSNFLREASLYDLIQISADTLDKPDLYSVLQESKGRNPNLLVTLYIAAQCAPAWSLASSPLYGKVYADANASGWLKTGCGTCTCGSGGRSTACADLSSPWTEYLPTTMNTWIEQKDPENLVNGVFYDNVKAEPYCCPADTQQWQTELRKILERTTGFTGGNTLIYPPSPYLGSMVFAGHEAWPAVGGPCGWHANWNNGMRSFYGWVSQGGSYGLAYNPSGKGARDFATMRLGLASSLLTDRGFYHYWPGVVGGITVYDEYVVNLSTGRPSVDPSAKGYLGLPSGQAYDPLTGENFAEVYQRNPTGCTDGTSADLSAHVWVREYQNGVVLANPTSQPRTIPLDKITTSANLKRILGTQDSIINNGERITGDISLPAGDGLILLKEGTSPTPTLTVALTANPSSGQSPLRGVDLTASVSGTATGNVNYIFYCNRSDAGTNITTPYSVRYDNVSETQKIAVDLCDYEIGSGQQLSLAKGWNKIQWESSYGSLTPEKIPAGCFVSAGYEGGWFEALIKDWAGRLSQASGWELYLKCEQKTVWSL